MLTSGLIAVDLSLAEAVGRYAMECALHAIRDCIFARIGRGAQR